MTHNELVRTALGHVFWLDVLRNVVDAYQSTMPIETAHFRAAVQVKYDDSVDVLERQDKIETEEDVNRLELGVCDSQCLEWKLDVAECQFAKEIRIGQAWKRVE